MVTATIPAASQSTPSHGQSSAAAKRSRHAHIFAAPALFAAVCFACGILAAHFAWLLPGLLLIALLALFLVAAIAVLRAPWLAWLAAGLLYLALGAFCFEAAPAIDPQTQLAHLADGSPRQVIGEVVRVGAVRNVLASSPFSNEVREEHNQQIDLRLNSIPGAPNSSVRATLYTPLNETLPHISCGDEVRATLAMHTEERFLDPGVWDAGQYLHSIGIGALASIKPQNFAVIAPAQHAELRCRLHSLQQAASAKIIDFADDPANSRLPAFLRIDREDASMLAAMLTGDRTYLQRAVRVGFERTGSFHLLVVSGLHLAIFSGLIFWLAKCLRLPRIPATIVTILGSLAYAVFTGFGHPVERAFWMVTLYLICRLLWRERSALNVIGVVALLMLAADPASLADSGFQMTLLSVLAIAGVTAPVIDKSFGPYLHALRNLDEIRIDPALPPRIAQFRVALRMLTRALQPLAGRFLARKALPSALQLSLRIAELLVVSVTIEFFMMLPMVIYFHRVTLLALPVNLLIVPLLTVLVPCAVATFAAVLLLPATAFIPGAATAAVLHIGVRLVTSFAGLHAGDLRLPMPAPANIVLWIVLMIAALCAVRMRRFALSFTTAALALAAALLLLPHPIARRAGVLEVTAIDVGQGDSLLIVTPQGKTLLIDAGGLVGASPDSNFNMGEDVVSPVLWSRGIRRLDAVAITHGHADHIGGMPAVLLNFRPRELWIGKNPDVPVFQRLFAEAGQTGTEIQTYLTGDTFSFGGVSIRVLAPNRDYRPSPTPTNNDSLVLRLSYGTTSALLEGDAEAPSEARMLAAGGLQSQLLKVGHHGSRTSTTPAFLAAVSPAYSVISVGRRNFYGHPRHEVLEELQAAHVATYRTDMLGLSTFYLDGKHVTAEAWAATH